MAKARFRLEGHVGEIVIADPPLNLLGLDLSRDLASAAAEASDSTARAILVRAEGENFSAGANVAMFRGRDEAAARELIEEFMPTSGDSPRSRCRRSPRCKDSAWRRVSRSR